MTTIETERQNATVIQRLKEIFELIAAAWVPLVGLLVGLYWIIGTWNGVSTQMAKIDISVQELQSQITAESRNFDEHLSAQSSSVQKMIDSNTARIQALEAYKDATDKRLGLADTNAARLSEQISAMQASVVDLKGFIQGIMTNGHNTNTGKTY